MEGQFRFKHAHDWLDSHIQEAVDKGDIAGVASITRSLMLKVDSDTIQDIFERDMDKDGYFEPISREMSANKRRRKSNTRAGAHTFKGEKQWTR